MEIEEKIVKILSEEVSPEEVAKKLGIPVKTFIKALEKKLTEHQEEVEEILEEVAESSETVIECQAKLILAAGMARCIDEDYDVEMEGSYITKAQEIVEHVMEQEENLYESVQVLSVALESLLFMHTQQDMMYDIAMEYETTNKNKVKKVKNVIDINKNLEDKE